MIYNIESTYYFILELRLLINFLLNLFFILELASFSDFIALITAHFLNPF